MQNVVYQFLAPQIYYNFGVSGTICKFSQNAVSLSLDSVTPFELFCTKTKIATYCQM